MCVCVWIARPVKGVCFMTSETSPVRSCPVQYLITHTKLCCADETHTHTHINWCVCACAPKLISWQIVHSWWQSHWGTVHAQYRYTITVITHVTSNNKVYTKKTMVNGWRLWIIFILQTLLYYHMLPIGVLLWMRHCVQVELLSLSALGGIVLPFWFTMPTVFFHTKVITQYSTGITSKITIHLIVWS